MKTTVVSRQKLVAGVVAAVCGASCLWGGPGAVPRNFIAT